MLYRVIWEVDIDADNPVEATKMAHDIQLDPESSAQYFTLIDEDGGKYEVDLILEEWGTVVGDGTDDDV